MKAVSGLTGWRWTGGHKDLDCSQVFKAPGKWRLNVGDALRRGELIVRNTGNRVKDFCQNIEDTKGADTSRPAAAAQLAGRLGFVASQVFGRTRSARTWQLRGREGGGPFTEELVASLWDWVTMLKSAHPRLITQLREADPPAIVFTDGFCGQEASVNAGCGTCVLEAFGAISLLELAKREVGCR